MRTETRQILDRLRSGQRFLLLMSSQGFLRWGVGVAILGKVEKASLREAGYRCSTLALTDEL